MALPLHYCDAHAGGCVRVRAGVGQTFPTALAALGHNGQGHQQERGLKHEAFTGTRLQLADAP